MELVYGKPATPIPTVSSPVCEGETIYFSTSVISNASYQWYDPTGSLISSSREFEIIGAIPGMSGDYSLKLAVNGCDSDLSTTTVLVNGKPALPEILGTLVLCEGEDLTLTTNIVSGASYEWKNQVGQVVGTTSALDIGNIQLNQAGNYSVQHTINGCPSELTNVNVVVNALPAKPVASANSPLCEEETITLHVSEVSGVTYTWYRPDGSVLGNGNDIQITDANVGMSGVYLVKGEIFGCNGELGDVNVIVNAKPVLPLINSNTPLCEGETLILQTNTISGATYTWKNQAGLEVGNSEVVNLINASPAQSGDYSLWISINGCISEESKVSILIKAKPAAPAASVTSPVCEGDIILFTSNTIANADYTWLGLSGENISSAEDFSLPNAALFMSGKYELFVTVNGCISPSTPVQLTVNPLPDVPVLNSNSPICEGETLELMSNAIPNVTYLWNNDTSDVGTGQNILISNATTSMSGNYSLQVFLGGCAGNPVSIPVIVRPLPSIPDINVNSPVCEGENIIFGTTAISDSYQWSGPNTFADATNAPQILSASPLNSGKYSLVVTTEGCTSLPAFSDVLVYGKPVKPAITSNSPLCSGDNLSLGTDWVQGGTYMWTGPLGFSSFDKDPNIDNVQVDHGGLYELKVVVNGCESEVASTSVNVKQSPAKPLAHSNSPVCTGLEVALSTDFVQGAIYFWQGPLSYSSILQNPVITSAQANQSGIYTLKVTVDGCESEVTSLDVRVEDCDCPIDNNNLIIPSLSSFCGASGNLTISGEIASPAGGNYRWELSTDGNIYVPAPGVNDEKDYIIGNLDVAGNYYFKRIYFTTTGIICEEQSNVVVIEIKNKPAPVFASNNGPICEGSDLQLSGTLVAGAQYAWNGPDGFASIIQNPIIYGVTAAKTGIYMVQVTVNGCVSDQSSTSVVVKTKPGQPILSSNSPVCEGQDIILNAQPVAGAIYHWSGPNTFNSNLADPVILTAGISHQGQYILAIEVDGCIGESSSINIAVTKKASAPIIAGNSPLCQGEDLSISTPSIPNTTYKWTGPASFIDNNSSFIIGNVTSIHAGSYNLIATFNGCESEVSQYMVVVKDKPEVPLISGNSPVCIGDDIQLNGDDILNASYDWTGPASFTSNSQDPVIQNADLINAGKYILVVEVDGCESEPAQIDIIVEDCACPITGNDIDLPSIDNFCVESEEITITGQAALPAGGIYLWEYSTDGGIYAPAPGINDGQHYTTPKFNSGTHYLRRKYVTTSGIICEEQSNQVLITVKEIPVVGNVSSNSPICEGSDLKLFTDLISGASYEWRNELGQIISTSQNPVINGATTANKGTYQLVISSNGCQSVPSSILVDVVQKPVVISAGSNSPVCEGDELQLSTDEIPGAAYNWTGPLSFISTIQEPKISDAIAGNDGNYQLVVSLNGCDSDPFTIIAKILSKPALPQISSVSPVCEGDLIDLFTAFVPNAIYEWTGPSLFTSDLQNPQLINATQAMNGTYTLRIIVDGCESDVAQYTVKVENCNCLIDKNELPLPANVKYCGTTGSILINGEDATPSGGTYRWEYSADGVLFLPVSGSNGNKDYTTGLLSPGIHYFRRNYTTTSGVICEELSNVIEIKIYEKPGSPIIDNNGPVCPGEDVTLTTDFIDDASYVWNGPAGFGSSIQNPTITNFSSGAAGQYTLKVIKDGCESDVAITTVGIKTVPVATNLRSNGPVCFGDDIQLSVDQISGATYLWTGPDNFTSTDRNPVIANVGATHAGSYFLQVTLDGCDGVPVSINVATENCACNIAGNSLLSPSQTDFCEKAENIVFDGDPATPAGGIYQWIYRLDGGSFTFASGISDREDYQALSLGVGQHGFRRIYTTTVAPICIDTTEEIEINVLPNDINVAIDVSGTLCEGQDVYLTASVIPGASYQWTGPNGFISNQQNPVITQADVNASGTYTLTVMVPGCTAKQASQQIEIKSLPATPQLDPDISACEGQNVSVTPSLVANATYVWSGPDGFISNQRELVINNVILGNSGNYALVVSVNGCASSAANTLITINEIPDLPKLNSNSPACEGSEIILSTLTNPGDNLAWKGPNGFTSDKGTISIKSINSSHAGWYEAVLTRNGCSSPPALIEVEVVAKPQAPDIQSNGPVCLDKELILQTSSVQGATYAWSGPLGFQSNQQNPVLNNMTDQMAGVYSVMVIVNGCVSDVTSMAVGTKDCSCQISDNLINSNDPVVFCDESPEVAINGSQPSPAGGTFAWQYGKSDIDFDNVSGGSNDKDFSAGKLGVGKHYFRRIYSINNGNICQDTSNVWIINVVSNHLDSIDITLDPDPACIGDTIMVIIENEMDGVAYSWSVLENGMTIINSNGRAALFTPQSAGVYDIQVRQRIEGCEESLPATVKLTVLERPFVFLGNDTTYCNKDGLITLEVGSFDEFLWSDGSTESSIVVSDKGSYSVTVTDEFGCRNSDEISIKTFCCKITYPNIIIADYGSVNSQFKLVDDGCVISSKLRVYDRWGNKMYDSDNGLEPWEGKFNGEYVEQGVYTFIFNYTALDEDEQEFKEKISGDITVIRK
ncbi:MAG: gliding motility-associated C-terminal domain-containing protein [Saprospiraceae bacterium]|nr:gliding motility-associated C-terminal domain-containing protein [Saprospiraceae bacterium]